MPSGNGEEEKMKREIMAELAEKRKYERVESSSIVRNYQKTKQKFAIFGTTAVEILKIKYTADAIGSPITRGDGFFTVKHAEKYYFYENAHESRVLSYTIFTVPRTMERVRRLMWLPAQWIYTEEMDIPTTELNDKIMEELEENFSTHPEWF